MVFRARFSWLEATRKTNVWHQPELLLTLRACRKFLGFRLTPPHYNKSGLCGFEKKNHNFTGFASGALKGLWFSNFFLTDNILVITESAIDGLSYEVLHGLKSARYLSIGGNMNADQLELLRGAMQKMEGGEVHLAFDNDEGGAALAEQVKAVAPSGVRITRPLPKAKDWNQV